jgi:hypothetical protein
LYEVVLNAVTDADNASSGVAVVADGAPAADVVLADAAVPADGAVDPAPAWPLAPQPRRRPAEVRRAVRAGSSSHALHAGCAQFDYTA